MIDEIDLREIEEITKPIVETLMEELCDEWEGGITNTEVVESMSRDGFIPLTDGGISSNFFVGVENLAGNGYLGSLPKKAFLSLDNILESSRKDALECFYQTHEIKLKELGFKSMEEVCYFDLYEKEQEDLAEELSELEHDLNSDLEIMFDLEVYLYEPEHSQNPFPGENKYGCYIYGCLNWEAPYFRLGKYPNLQWNTEEVQFTFKNNTDFKKKIKKNLIKAIKEMKKNV